MTEVQKSSLDEKMEAVNAKFEQAKDLLKAEQEKQGEIQRNINAITEEAFKLQGEYRVLKELKEMEEGEKKEAKPTIPSNGNKKK